MISISLKAQINEGGKPPSFDVMNLSTVPVVIMPSIDLARLKTEDSINDEELLMQGMMDEVLMKDYSLQLYPNPSYDMVNIFYNIPSVIASATIEISNCTGILVKKYNLNLKDNVLIINTSNLKKGLYFVSLVCNNNKTNVTKLVIQ